MSRWMLGVRCHARYAPSFRRPDKNRDNALNRVLYTYDDLSRSDASLPTSLVSSITYVKRCRRYVMTMTRQTRRTIEGIAVTVSMPHRFPYGSLLLFSFFFFSRYARTVIVDLTDRSLLLRHGFYEARCISIARGLVGGSHDIESDDSSRSVVHGCYFSTSAIRTAIFAHGAAKMYFSRAVVRWIKETAMAVA